MPSTSASTAPCVSVNIAAQGDAAGDPQTSRDAAQTRSARIRSLAPARVPLPHSHLQTAALGAIQRRPPAQSGPLRRKEQLANIIKRKKIARFRSYATALCGRSSHERGLTPFTPILSPRQHAVEPTGESRSRELARL